MDSLNIVPLGLMLFAGLKEPLYLYTASMDTLSSSLCRKKDFFFAVLFSCVLNDWIPASGSKKGSQLNL